MTNNGNDNGVQLSSLALLGGIRFRHFFDECIVVHNGWFQSTSKPGSNSELWYQEHNPSCLRWALQSHLVTMPRQDIVEFIEQCGPMFSLHENPQIHLLDQVCVTPPFSPFLVFYQQPVVRSFRPLFNTPLEEFASNESEAEVVEEDEDEEEELDFEVWVEANNMDNDLQASDELWCHLEGPLPSSTHSRKVQLAGQGILRETELPRGSYRLSIEGMRSPVIVGARQMGHVYDGDAADVHWFMPLLTTPEAVQRPKNLDESWIIHTPSDDDGEWSFEDENEVDDDEWDEDDDEWDDDDDE